MLPDKSQKGAGNPSPDGASGLFYEESQEKALVAVQE